MGTHRPTGPRYLNNSTSTVVSPPGLHKIDQRFAPPRANQMAVGGRPPNNNIMGSQYFPTPNYQYYPPPPPPPRPPQAFKMVPPGEPLMPPGISDTLSDTSRYRGPAPPPPAISAKYAGMNGYAPLAPPPLPPLFPYLSPELAQSLQEGATQCGQSFAKESSDLPFVPIIIDHNDLKKLTEVWKTQVEDRKEQNLLLYEDILDQRLPKELKEMCQPLYCKLCKLTLSSPVVARDHYKGKRHKKAEELWLQNNPNKTVKPKAAQNVSTPQGSSLINGTVTAAVRPNADKMPPLLPHLNQRDSRDTNDRMPFPVPASPIKNQNNKRSMPQNNHEFIPAYRAALAGPGPAKKPRKEDGSGPKFGFCEPCQVTLTSQVNADQHYSGKKHKDKILNGRKSGEFGEDPRFGIGSSFSNNRPPVQGGPNAGKSQQRFN